MRRVKWFLLGMVLAGCQHTKVGGTGGTKLGLTAPANQWLKQGQSNAITIHINRDDFTGPVDIEFSNLPAGVTIANPGPVATGDFLKDYTLVAAADAPLVKQHVVTVTASARDMPPILTWPISGKLIVPFCDISASVVRSGLL